MTQTKGNGAIDAILQSAHFSVTTMACSVAIFQVMRDYDVKHITFLLLNNALVALASNFVAICEGKPTTHPA